MNLKNSQYQAIMRQYDLRQLQHRHLQSQRYQEICDRLPAYRQLEEETASFCADRARLLPWAGRMFCRICSSICRNCRSRKRFC